MKYEFDGVITQLDGKIKWVLSISPILLRQSMA
jgi:hypothetical protein